MSFKVQVGPAQISIHQGRTVLVCEPDGTVPGHGEKGLYFNNTRIISSWSLYADGTRWELLSGGAISHDALRINLTNRKLDTASSPVASGATFEAPPAAKAAGPILQGHRAPDRRASRPCRSWITGGAALTRLAHGS